MYFLHVGQACGVGVVSGQVRFSACRIVTGGIRHFNCLNQFSRNVMMPPEEFIIASLEGHDLILSKCLSSVICFVFSAWLLAIFSARFFSRFALQKGSLGSVTEKKCK